MALDRDRKPCSSSRKILSMLPAFPSDNATLLPIRLVRASSYSRRMVKALSCALARLPVPLSGPRTLFGPPIAPAFCSYSSASPSSAAALVGSLMVSAMRRQRYACFNRQVFSSIEANASTPSRFVPFASFPRLHCKPVAFLRSAKENRTTITGLVSDAFKAADDGAAAGREGRSRFPMHRLRSA